MAGPESISIYLLTDIPVWTRSLEQALVERGARVAAGSDWSTADEADVVVNRLSSRMLRISDQDRQYFVESLRQREAAGKPIINPAHCLEIGLSKMRQHELFQACGVQTPETALAVAGERVFPDRDVYLKPPAGGFGKGIRRLAAGEPATDEFEPTLGWVEQEAITPSDGIVHRVELVGGRILYEASTPFRPDHFDYCLVNAGDTSWLTASEAVDPTVKEQALMIAERGGMQLGGLEYFLVDDGVPCFFDFNPVSSLHPKAEELAGVDPIEIAADYILRSAS